MKKGRTTYIVLVLIFLIGLSLLLYPLIADYWNSLHQSHAIADYVEVVNNLDDETNRQLLASAEEYNKDLAKRSNYYILTDEQKAQYPNMLDATGLGIMGYIEISKINCVLPIYHGTDAGVLQIAVGHMEWSSLPIGGESTHCVLSGHRGLPTATLFSNLDQMELGDTFVIRVLDNICTYEVDQILIVKPDEIESLGTVPGKDYCTLVTCTPYGVNSHRLLVRGHRIENAQESSMIRVTSDAIPIDPMLVAPIVSIPLLIILMCLLFLQNRGMKKRKHPKTEE